MEKKIRLLSLLLISQIAVAIFLNLSNDRIEPSAMPEALISTPVHDIDDIIIEGENGNKVWLEKKGTQWILPSQQSLPADSRLVYQFLNTLSDLTISSPIATSEEAQARFEVSNADFMRRITISNHQQELLTFYIGSASSARHAHIRIADDTSIYTSGISAYQVPSNASEWLDKALLQIPQQDIETIKVSGSILVREKSANEEDQDIKKVSDKNISIWHATESINGEKPNQKSISELLSILANIKITATRESTDTVIYGLDNPLLTIEVGLKEGKTLKYALAQGESQQGYTLKRSDYPELFQVNLESGEKLIKAASRQQIFSSTLTEQSENIVPSIEEKSSHNNPNHMHQH